LEEAGDRLFLTIRGDGHDSRPEAMALLGVWVRWRDMLQVLRVLQHPMLTGHHGSHSARCTANRRHPAHAQSAAMTKQSDRTAAPIAARTHSKPIAPAIGGAVQSNRFLAHRREQRSRCSRAETCATRRQAKNALHYYVKRRRLRLARAPTCQEVPTHSWHGSRSRPANAAVPPHRIAEPYEPAVRAKSNLQRAYKV
jgi:hypothetical protein